jgi:hypothetical protein
VAVVASTQPTRDIAALTSPDGSFRLGGLLPGSYRIRAHLGSTSSDTEVDVAAGAPTPVEIRLG